MKLTKQDIKTLEKIKKLCDKLDCKDCKFNDTNRKECILQNQPNWWYLDAIREE